ncbi:hypothetical protein, partial [uncultured Leptotrichia sp.]|uniref:hypothetical protein n=1 Tax=uncultured Leptotrichia sp. TaxID=159271 RepID=UPI002625682F
MNKKEFKEMLDEKFKYDSNSDTYKLVNSEKIEKHLNEIKEEFLDNSDLDKEDYKYKIEYINNFMLKITLGNK